MSDPLTGEERRHLATRRQDDFEHLDEKIDDRFGVLTDRLAHFIKRAIVGFAIIGLTSALALAGYGYLLREQHKTTNEIQQQRKETILRSCTEQNGRHNATIKVLDKVLSDTVKSNPKLKAQVKDSRAQNLLLINALVPVQNCSQLVKAATEGVGG